MAMQRAGVAVDDEIGDVAEAGDVGDIFSPVVQRIGVVQVFALPEMAVRMVKIDAECAVALLLQLCRQLTEKRTYRPLQEEIILHGYDDLRRLQRPFL